MLGIWALLLIGGMLAMPVTADDGDNTGEDDREPDRPGPKGLEHELDREAPAPSGTVETILNITAANITASSDVEVPSREGVGAPLGSAPDEIGPVTVETDPNTGGVNITVSPEATGRLMAFFEESVTIPGNEATSGGHAYGMTLLWVPEDIDFEEAANSQDWQAFFSANRDAGIEPDRADYFAAISVDLVQHWDLGERGFMDSSDGDLGDWPYAQIRFDDRTPLPEITANQEIAWFEVPGQEDLLSMMFFNAVELDPVDGPEAFTFDFQTAVESYPQGPAADGVISHLSPDDGDVIAGSAFDDYIDNPPGDPTAVTIMGGSGADKITAGLNDTIVTDDDGDADTIFINTPASFAQIYDEVPVIQAGPEDLIEIEAAQSLVVTYAQDQGQGVTTYFYHVVSAPAGFDLPSEILEADDAPLTLQSYYQAIGAQLLAQGSLGSLDSGNAIDTRLPAPQFSGVDLGFFTATLAGDAVVASTTFMPVTGVSAFA